MKRKATPKKNKAAPRVFAAVNWKRYASWSLGVLFLLVSAIAMGALVMKLSEHDTLPLRVIKIRGDIQYLDKADLEKRIAGLTRAGFFSVDVESIRKAAEELPWVRTLSVRRVWPDRLDIYVDEREPLALWRDGGLIDAHAVVFRPENIKGVGQLPKLSGPDADANLVVQQYEKFSRMLRNVNRALSEVVLDERGSWTLVLADGVIVRLGNQDVEQRASRLLRYIGVLDTHADNRVVSVDLRYTNGFAVRLEALPERDTGQS